MQSKPVAQCYDSFFFFLLLQFKASDATQHSSRLLQVRNVMEEMAPSCLELSLNIKISCTWNWESIVFDELYIYIFKNS